MYSKSLSSNDKVLSRVCKLIMLPFRN